MLLTEPTTDIIDSEAKVNNIPMIITIPKSVTVPKSSRGFTLAELMIVVAIIGILAAIAYPNYQRYVIKSKRTDMMSEMHNIASEIESRKLAKGSYKAISDNVINDFAIDYPKQRTALYTVIIEPNDPLTAQWKITAETIDDTQVDGDGNLSLNHQGLKCRGSAPNDKCGTGDNWNE